MCAFLLQNGALWYMELVHCEICEIGLISRTNTPRQTISISGTKSPQSNISRIILQLSLRNLMKPGHKISVVYDSVTICLIHSYFHTESSYVSKTKKNTQCFHISHHSSTMELHRLLKSSPKENKASALYTVNIIATDDLAAIEAKASAAIVLT